MSGALLPGVKGGFGSPEYELDRRATARKKAGDMAGAIAALRERKTIFGDQWIDTKLAKYLQHAGHFDEAMAEMQWLIDHSSAWAAWAFAHRPAMVLQRQRAGYMARLHADAALICRRAGDPAREAQHRELSGRYQLIRVRLERVAHTLAPRFEHTVTRSNRT